MRCPGILRALLVCAVLAVATVGLPAAAHAATSCGDFAPFGTLQGSPGYTLSYYFTSGGGQYDVTMHWGDGTSDTATVTSANTDSNPKVLHHTYNNPGSFDVTLSTSGTLSDGTSCSNSNLALGTVVIQQPQSTSCGDFTPLGTIDASPGYTLTYYFTGGNGHYDVTLQWGDGSSDSASVTTANTDSNPVALQHTYNNPGSFDLTLSTNGTLSDGTHCSDNNIPLGKVVIHQPQPPPPPQPTSCGTFYTFGTLQLEAGDGIPYELESHDATLDTATVDWGDGTSSSNSQPLSPNSTVTLPQPPPHRYNTPGTYQVFISVTGHFGDGTRCQDQRIHLGTVVVAPVPVSSTSPPPPVPGGGCRTCTPPSRTTAKNKCNKFLRKASGRLGRIFRHGTQRRTTCGAARGTSRTCTTTVVYAPCGCRYIITTLVPAKGTPHVIKVRRKKLRGHHRKRKHATVRSAARPPR